MTEAGVCVRCRRLVRLDRDGNLVRHEGVPGSVWVRSQSDPTCVASGTGDYYADEKEGHP